MAVSIQCLAENRGLAFAGDDPGGRFGMAAADARRLLAATNPHGKPNSDVIRPSAGSADLRRRPRGRWTVDFPPGTDEREAVLYQRPYARIRRLVKPVRGRRARAWWIHRAPRPAMRVALAKRDRFLATPAAARHHVFAWLPPEVLPDRSLVVFARDDDWFFGVLQSRIHQAWAWHLGPAPRGGGPGVRYVPGFCFETFPFPWPPATPLGRLTRAQEDQRTAVAQAARTLDAHRRDFLGGQSDSQHTLTALYTARPAWLEEIHVTLDAAVATAYGWPAGLGDDEIIARLTELNRVRAGGANVTRAQTV